MKTYSDMNDKVAIVTGGASGIGGATARALAESGVKVVVNYHRNQGGADAIVAAIRQGGGQAVAVRADVRLSAECGALAAAATSQFGPVDILVNNAGSLAGRQRILDLTEEQWDEALDLNLKSAYLCTRAVAKSMMDRKTGAIVHVSSVAGRNGGTLPGAAHYVAAKAGLIAFSKNLAKEMAPHNVHVNAVCPGVIDTPFHKSSLTPDVVKNIVAAIPLGRLGTAEEVARVIAFLCSTEASYLCGETIEVNGGMLML